MLQRLFKKVFNNFCEQFAKWKHPNLFQKYFASGTSSISTLGFHTQNWRADGHCKQDFNMGVSVSQSWVYLSSLCPIKRNILKPKDQGCLTIHTKIWRRNADTTGVH